MYRASFENASEMSANTKNDYHGMSWVLLSCGDFSLHFKDLNDVFCNESLAKNTSQLKENTFRNIQKYIIN